MKSFSWFLHPVIIFIFSIVALGLSLFLYIYWYVEVSAGLQTVLRKTNLDPSQFVSWQTWMVIMVLSILVGIILVGIFIIFVYQMKANALYRLQNNFINSFTHELKTPVTSMQLYLETFRMHELPREMELKYIDYMLADVARLTENINRILNLARIEAKIFEGKFMLHDLVRVVEEFCARNGELFRMSTIRIHNPSGREFPYPINRPLFEMLIMNLLANAVKHNDSETPEVDISFLPQHNGLHISFADNGIGFERSDARKIFRKFYQIERPGRPQEGGSGLGLYMVEHIARLHKGKVRAASKGAGQGAAVTIILPWRPEQPAAQLEPPDVQQ